jgi:ERCC4-type nuclease
MINNYHYTDSEQKQLLKSLVILVDTRENVNDHITSYFSSKGIVFKSCKLDSGDYSVMLPAAPDLGIVRDLYFDLQIIIERKADLNELSGNLAQYRQRFEAEFYRIPQARKYLLIESGSYGDIFTSNYKTGLNSAAFAASLMTFQARFGLNVSFVSREHSGKFIYGLLHYYLREMIV